MRNISLTNFESRRLSKIKDCEIFCFDNQTLYAYDKGVIIKCVENNEEILCDLQDTLYPTSDNNNISKPIEIIYHYEKKLLYLILLNGDILSVETEGSSKETIVGSVEDGIKAAQWSPEQELVALVNGVDNVIVITDNFDSVSEVHLHGDDYGEKQNVTVGWGKKETQFRGSAGKFSKDEEEEKVIFEESDKINISWRGDAEYFAVLSKKPDTNFRYLRIFSKKGVLQYTSDSLPGVEDCLDWSPSGNMLASTQRLPNKYNICFYEKNGMKHGEFTVCSNSNFIKIIGVHWSKDSRILAVFVSEKSTTQTNNNCNTHSKKYIQFYTVSNYKWYCKYTINFDELNIPLCVKWDAQKHNVFHVILVKENTVYHYKYTWIWVVNKSRGNSLHDESFVAVIDGCNVNLTPFKQGITPPPMCDYTIKLDFPVNLVSFASESSNDLLVQLSNGNVFVYKCHSSNNEGKIGHELIGMINPIDNKSEVCYNCQWVGVKKFLFFMVQVRDIQKPFLRVIDVEEFGATTNYHKKEIDMLTTAAIVRVLKSIAVIYDNTGSTMLFNNNTISELFSKKNQTIMEMEVLNKKDESLSIFTLDSSNKFYMNCELVFNNILSFLVHDKFILLTTMKHELLCINSEENIMQINAFPEMFKRKVERGSRLITSVQRDMKVILQMPRGNLECIQPRALTVYAVGKYLNSLNYAEAFNLMRKQRINLNLIYDHNPVLFSINVKTFIQQISDPQWINLFISDITEEDVTETMYAVLYKKNTSKNGEIKTHSKIDDVCDLMERALSATKNEEKYILPILTCHIKRDKIEFLESALLKLKTLREKEMQGIKSKVSFDEAFKYILYLIDVDEVYKIALGMYDFDLALVVANKSQKDPKEYLPFLNNLKKLESHYQKYTIDKYLKRYERALTNIIQCDGEDVFNECLSFIKVHNLYKEALKLIPQGTPKYEIVCASYGEELLKNNMYEEAGLIFFSAGLYKSAFEAYKKSKNWIEVFICARELEFTTNQLSHLYEEAALDYSESKNFMKAASIYLNYLKNAEECIKMLTNGKFYAEAYQICYVHNRKDLIGQLITPTILNNANAAILEIINLQSDIEKQKNRLQVVRKKKLEESENKIIYDMESDAYSEASTVVTHSQVTSRASNRTYRSAKNKRKQERKLLSLKEGSPYEHLALVISLHNLITTAIDLKPEIRELNKSLVKINNYKLAETLQNEFENLLRKIEESKSEIWIPDLLHGTLGLGPATTSNEIAATYISCGNVTPNLLNPKYATPPQTENIIQWKLEILK